MSATCEMLSKTTVRASAGEEAMLASPAAAIGRAEGFNFLMGMEMLMALEENLGEREYELLRQDQEVVRQLHLVKKSLNVLKSSSGSATSFKSSWKSEMNLGLLDEAPNGEEEGGGASVSRRELFEATQQPRAHLCSGIRVRKRLAVAVRHALQQSFDG